MRILLDENIDVRFKYLFKDTLHEVFTVKDMNWLGIKNGELLKLMEVNHFEIFIAVDKNLLYQQNKNKLPRTIIILNVKRNILKRITILYPSILDLISKPLQKEIFVLNE